MANDTKFRTLSLFSGIGGIDLALQRRCKTVCYCEIDPYACGVLIKNMAKGSLDLAPIWSDVRTLGEPELEAVGPIDAVVGGFPCQDISCAGKQAGIKEESRSGLFFEIIRLIRLVRPRIIFLENVPAITYNGMGTVLGELAESGYDAKWRCLSAAEVGARHRRIRWWCLAHAQCERTGDIGGPAGRQKRQPANSLESATLRQKNGEAGTTGANPTSENVAYSPCKRLEGEQSKRLGQTQLDGGSKDVPNASRDWWSAEPDVGRVANGVPFRVDRLRCLGNAVVPQCAEKAFELLMEIKP